MDELTGLGSCCAPHCNAEKGLFTQMKELHIAGLPIYWMSNAPPTGTHLTVLFFLHGRTFNWEHMKRVAVDLITNCPPNKSLLCVCLSGNLEW
jgi:hypothetical protein